VDTPAPNSLSLHELLQNVDRAIQSGLPSSYWVRAEILQVQDRGWWSLELSSYDEGKKAKARAMIWQSQSAIVTKFEQSTGAKLAKGLKVLVRVKVAFHAEYGLSLTVQEFDPAFSLGDMEARVNQIRDRLSALYELTRNRELETPADFTRVAVIAPKEAAGLGDFRTQADLLENHNLCSFNYFSALFQGEKSEQSLINAMKAVLDEHTLNPFDVVVLIRGGGDKAGIYELNQFKIARGVCRLPIPVFVGVGHERDSTILDEVANIAFATPSLVIASIVSSVVGNAREAERNFNTMTHSSKQLLESARSSCRLMQENMLHRAIRGVAEARNRVKESHQEILAAPRELLQEARRVLEHNYSTLGHGAEIWLRQQRESLNISRQTVRHTAQQVLGESKSVLRLQITQLGASAESSCARASELLHRQRRELSLGARRILENSRSEVKGFNATVVNLNPELILKRGFVLALDSTGKPIVKASELSLNDSVDLTFQDATASAKIEKLN